MADNLPVKYYNKQISSYKDGSFGSEMAMGEGTPKDKPPEVMVPPPRGKGGLFLSPLTVFRLLRLFEVCQYVVLIYYRMRPALRSSRGRKQVYSDVSILLISVLMALWQLSYDRVLQWLEGWDDLALAMGLPVDSSGKVLGISKSRFSERKKQLGILPFFLLFLVLVRRAMTMGLIVGQEFIIDSTLIKAWSKKDIFAGWSYPVKKKLRVFGYKMHVLLDSCSCLPVMVMVSSANIADVVLFKPLLGMAFFVLGLVVKVVKGDAGYDSYKEKVWASKLFGAAVFTNFNIRGRKGVRLILYSFIRWLKVALRGRYKIERFFAFVKRYYGLGKYVGVGKEAICIHVYLVQSCVLVIAMTAYKQGREDLMFSPHRVLAYL